MYISCPQALFVASKLKVFDILKDKGTLTATEAANKLKTSVCGTERLLDACTSLGLLDKNHLGESSSLKHLGVGNEKELVAGP